MTIERLRARWLQPEWLRYCPIGGCKVTDTLTDYSNTQYLAPVGSECKWLPFALKMTTLEELGTFSVEELRTLLKRARASNAELSVWANESLKATVPLESCYIGKNLYEIKLLKDVLMYQDADTKFVVRVVDRCMHLSSDKLHIFVAHHDMETMRKDYGNRGFRAL